MKVALFSLPPYQPTYMHPAIPYITGAIKAKMPEVEVRQEDLNTSALDFFLGKEIIAPMRDIEVYHNFPEFVKAKQAIAAKIRAATGGRLIIDRNTVNYVQGDEYKSRAGLLHAVANKGDNLFYKFFAEQVVPQIGEDVVGLSVSDQKQIVPAAILASMIKEYHSSTQVVLGGNIITRGYDVLSKDDILNRELFKHFDYLIHHEGETAFTELVKRLKEGRDVEGVPKLIFMRNGQIRENLEFVVESPNELPVPNYDGFVAQRNHWTPSPVLSYLLGRGCGEACSFCDIPIGYDGSIKRFQAVTEKQFKIEGYAKKRRAQDLGKVALELRQLRDRYQTKYFSFSDEEISGKLLKDFVALLEKEDLGIEWESFGRIEPAYLDKEFCRRIRGTGGRFIQFGVESASQTVLDKIHKGYSFGIANQVLTNTYEAGIMNHAFTLQGLPRDTLIDLAHLVSFLETQGERLTTIKPISYKVSKWSPAASHPEEFGMRLDKEGTPDLEQRINMRNQMEIMSRHKAMAATRFLELWVAQCHEPNPATKIYAFTQRLFLSRDEIENFGRSVHYDAELLPEDIGAMRKVYSGLSDEIKILANSGQVPRERRQRFAQLFDRLRREDLKGISFNQVLELCREVSNI